jgi:hypothetical protein
MAGEHAAPVNWLERWRETEPLRLYLYGITLPVLALCLAYGWLTTDQLGAWAAVAAALFLGSTAAGELARRRVWAPATVDLRLQQVDDRAYADGLEDGERRGALVAASPVPATEAMPAQRPRTSTIPALGRCRRVEDARRCTLPMHPEDVGHVF